jgi:hypothetical protein
MPARKTSIRSVAMAAAVGLFCLTSASLRAQTVVNPSFETVSQSINSDTYTITFGSLPVDAVTGWTFGVSGGASYDGILIDNSGLSAHNIPDGDFAALIQGTGSISQTISGFSSGAYQLSFMLESRGGGDGPNPLSVTIDGSPITFASASTVAPSSSTNFALFTSDPFDVTAGSHTLEIDGTIPYGAQDKSTFVDVVNIALVPEPAVIVQVGVLLLGGCLVHARRRK